MAQTSTVKSLSGSVTGLPISITGTTSGTANTLHTSTVATATNVAFDLVTLYATNISTSAVLLTVCFGGTATTDFIELTVPAQSGQSLVISAIPVNNSLVVSAFAATTAVINITGGVTTIQ